MLLTEDSNSVRKAAVLFRSLEPEAAAVLLAQLSPEEGRALRTAVRELAEVSEDEREAVAAELRGDPQSLQETALMPQATRQATDGVELSLGALHESSADDVYRAVSVGGSNSMPDGYALENGYSDANETPDSCLRELGGIEPATLAQYLSREQPQTIAVVLSDLEPEQAARVLDELPQEVRMSSLERLADLGDADPESLKVLAADLNDWIAKNQREQQRQEQRIGKIGAILEASNSEQRESLLEGLRERGHEWVVRVEPEYGENQSVERAAGTSSGEDEFAEVDESDALIVEVGTDRQSVESPETIEIEAAVPSPPPVKFPFAAMVELDAMDLAEVMKHTPPRQLLLSLAGGEEVLQRRIESILPRQQSKQLRRQLVSLGPLKLRDIDLAQERMCQVAASVWKSRHARNGRRITNN